MRNHASKAIQINSKGNAIRIDMRTKNGKTGKIEDKEVVIEPLVDVDAENSKVVELIVEESKLEISKQRHLYSAKKIK